MARADLLLAIVRAGAERDSELFRSALEGLVADERSKQHNILADRLATYLDTDRRTLKAPNAATNDIKGNGFTTRIPRKRISDLTLTPGIMAHFSELVEEHHRASLLRAHNIEPRNRVILTGPPGNGKTSLAEAIAYALACPLLVVRYESLIGSYLGETAARLSNLFKIASAQRCVLFFDEFDAVGKKRGDVHESGEIKRVVSSLLLEIDDLPPHVVAVAATNHSDLLDHAVWRRFQLRITLPPPTLEQRLKLLATYESTSGISFEYTHTYIARKLSGLSCAELEQFAHDVQRRVILSTPDSDTRQIVKDQLGRWTRERNPE